MEWIDNEANCTFPFSLLRTIPQYDILEALHLVILQTAPLFPDYPISLTRLHSLILETNFEWTRDRVIGLIASWRLPSLVYHSLACQGHEFTPSLERFFRSFGHNITSLLLEHLDEEMIPSVLGHCPSVQNLLVRSGRRREHLYNPLPPTPQLQRIQFKVEHMDCDRFLKTVEHVYMPNSPSLHCIQLLDVTRADLFSEGNLEDSQRWRALGDNWLEKGIRLEDAHHVWIGGDESAHAVSDSEDERDAFLRLRKSRK
jgi:hypothetical protein